MRIWVQKQPKRKKTFTRTQTERKKERAMGLGSRTMHRHLLCGMRRRRASSAAHARVCACKYSTCGIYPRHNLLIKESTAHWVPRQRACTETCKTAYEHNTNCRQETTANPTEGWSCKAAGHSLCRPLKLFHTLRTAHRLKQAQCHRCIVTPPTSPPALRNHLGPQFRAFPCKSRSHSQMAVVVKQHT